MTNQRGFTLIEMAMATAVAGALLLGSIQSYNAYQKDVQAAADAETLKRIENAAQSYLNKNYAALVGVATATNPALIRVSDLIADGELPSGFQNTLRSGQSVCVLVKEPTANNLEALVVTEGGDAYDDTTATKIAGLMKNGGAVYTASTNITGYGGSWTKPVSSFDNLPNHLGQRCDGSAGNVRIQSGHVFSALWLSSEDADGGLLHRNNIPSRPELNRMNAPLDMAGNDVSNAGTVNANSVNASSVNVSGTASVDRLSGRLEVATVASAGDACDVNGRIARDSTGKLLTCQSNVWEAAAASSGGGGTLKFDPQVRLAEWAWPGTYYWTVPAGVNQIHAEVVAGGGSKGRPAQYSPSGGGGEGQGVAKTVSVVPGERLTIQVGGGGGISSGGYGGGGSGGAPRANGVSGSGYGGGGGGGGRAGGGGGSFIFGSFGEVGARGGGGGGGSFIRGSFGEVGACGGGGGGGGDGGPGGGGGYGGGGGSGGYGGSGFFSGSPGSFFVYGQGAGFNHGLTTFYVQGKRYKGGARSSGSGSGGASGEKCVGIVPNIPGAPAGENGWVKIWYKQ